MKTLLLASLSAGCVVVPATKTSTTNLGTELEIATTADHGVELDGAANGDTITLRAIRKRDCEHRVVAVSRVEKTKHARLGGTTDVRGKIFGALLAPVTIPVSAMITGLVVVSAEPDVRRVKQIQSAKPFPCASAAADLPIHITLGSGATRDLRTTPAGTLAFAIPDGEPNASTVIASAGPARTSIDYQRPLPVMAAVREATRRCAGKVQFLGALQLKVTVGESGTPTHVSLDAGDAELAGCVTSSIAKLEFAPQHRNKSLVFPFQLR